MNERGRNETERMSLNQIKHTGGRESIGIFLWSARSPIDIKFFPFSWPPPSGDTGGGLQQGQSLPPDSGVGVAV